MSLTCPILNDGTQHIGWIYVNTTEKNKKKKRGKKSGIDYFNRIYSVIVFMAGRNLQVFYLDIFLYFVG